MKETTENKHNFESAVFKAEYQEILNTSISPSNILSFYERALVRLIALTEKTVQKYKARNPDTPLMGKDLEDIAYSEAGLADISSTLEAIEERQNQLHALQTLIETELHVSSEVFVPPSDENRYAIQPGAGNGIEEKMIFPRLLTLLYILENDLGISASPSEEDESDIEIVQGSVTDSMMRKQPYVRVSIPELKRIAYLCDEEGNATFIFDEEVMEAEDINVETLDTTDKAVFGELFSKHPELGTRIIYNKEKWRTDILEALSNDFVAESEKEAEIKRTPQPQKPKSDFAQHVEFPKKKEGWESASSLMKVAHAGIDNIKKYAETFKPQHPEWFEIQKTGIQKTEHYHPELVQHIVKHFESTPQKKEGWENPSTLIKMLRSDFNTIKSYAETFKPQHPEWFEIQKTGSREAEHYHPELVRLIKEHFESTPQKKEGWENATTLSKLLHLRTSSPNIKIYAETFKQEYPEWFEKQKNYGKDPEHYHPELVALIKEHFNKVPRRKEGWESASTLSRVLHISFDTSKEYAETYKQDHPEWFEVQKSRVKEVEHYHPELVTLIKEHFNKVSQKKEGWESASSLSKKVVYSGVVSVKNYAETFRIKYPEWFEKQRTGVHSTEHYHPELVQLIKEHFEKKRVR